MRYADSLQYLNSFLNLERMVCHPNNRGWNLRRMKFLTEVFGHPERSYPSVLIAGTKGKGSTGFFLESVLTSAGIPTGFYSSPHLESPRERIRICGRLLSEKNWSKVLGKIQKRLKTFHPPKTFGEFTYFEIMTLMAMLAFREAGVRIGIFEAGMGGRLDATNVLKAPVSVITPVSFDHEAFLGDTLAEIAREKAAIIRRHGVVITSRQHPEVMTVIRRKSRDAKAHLCLAKPVGEKNLGLAGDFQKVNAGLACETVRILKKRLGLAVSKTAVDRGLKMSGWPGRLESFKGQPEFVLDGAHNPYAVKALVKNLNRLYAGRPRLVIFGVARDKKFETMLAELGRFSRDIILTAADNPRSREIRSLLVCAREKFTRLYPVARVRNALALAAKIAGSNGVVAVTGSFYVVGEARTCLKSTARKARD